MIQWDLEEEEMGDADKCNTDMIHRLSSSFGTSSSCSVPNQQQINPNLVGLSSESGKRVGVPPTSPYSQIPTGATHSRSISQPCSFFSLDSLPPLSPCPFRADHELSMEDRGFNNNNPSSSLLPPSPFTRCNSSRVGESLPLPPRKSHRRSNSDIPTPFVKKEDMDDLFSAYMNLDAFNSSPCYPDDMDKTCPGSDTEGESSTLSSSADNRQSFKRSASGGDVAPSSRHFRSVSVDSCFLDKLSFPHDSLKPPPSPAKLSPTNSSDGNAAFSIDFNKGEFTAAEIKKIMANDKLAEMAVSDPKRVKRILANRQSAARSKERKMRYIVELEHKVQTLQTEATTLSAQLTLLQRDMMGLTNQNNELKFRLQAMEQQARLRDALNEALNGEVQRLKLAIGETSHNEADRSKMQSLNAEMFQQLNISQLRQQPQSQSQNGTMSTKPESNE